MKRPDRRMAGLGRAVLRLVPVTLVTGTLFFLSHQEGTSLPLPFLPGMDKVIHAGAYAVLAASALFVFPAAFRGQRPKTAALLAFVYCLLFGLSDEYHQSFITSRFPSGWDFAADLAGSLALVLAWLHFTTAGKRKARVR